MPEQMEFEFLEGLTKDLTLPEVQGENGPLNVAAVDLIVKAYKHRDGFAVQVGDGPVYVYTNIGAVAKVVKRELGQ